MPPTSAVRAATVIRLPRSGSGHGPQSPAIYRAEQRALADAPIVTPPPAEPDNTTPAPGKAGGTTNPFSGVLCLEGDMTGDGRLIEANALRWENLPIPLRYVASDVGAHDGAKVVGRITEITRSGAQILAKGVFDMDSEVGCEAYRQVQQGLTTGVSVDLDDVSFEYRVAGELLGLDDDDEGYGNVIEDPKNLPKDADGRVIVEQVKAGSEVEVITDARVRAATMVAIPAFEGARLSVDFASQSFDHEPAPADGDNVPQGDGDDDPPMEAVAAEDDPGEEDVEDFNWVDDVGGLPSYIKKISDALQRDQGMTESRAIATAVNACKRWCAGGGDVSASTRAQACTAVAEWEEKKARAKADSADSMPVASADTALVAAIPVDPPASWFNDPQLRDTTPIHVSPDGQVYGHIATWGTCHVGMAGECTQPPRTASDYAYFRTGSVLTAEGSEIAVGHLTMDTRHAGRHASPAATLRHYDHTGTAIADVTVGEDEYGIWVAGALRSTATPEQVRTLRSSPISGDWRRIGTSLELVAALAVNVPGFPVPRVQGLVAGASMQSLIAAGMLPPRKVIKPGSPGALSTEDLRYLKRLAHRERVNQAEQLTAMSRTVRASALAARIRG